MSVKPNQPAMPDGEQTATAAVGQMAQQSATVVDSTLENGKLKDTVAKAQQAASLYQGGQQALSQANPISNPFNHKPESVPFEDLDTPDATSAAASQDNNAAAALGDILAAKIAAKVFIGELAITEILSLRITQELGSHNQLSLRFFQDQAQTQGAFTFDGAEKLLGQVAEIELYNKTDPSSSPLRNLFVIADVQFQQDALNEGIIELIGYAPTWILDGQPHFETFYKKDLGSIAQSVCKSLSQVKASLKSDPTLGQMLPFVCRYNESVWNFLKRLSSETGQWLYFNGTELVFGKPESKQGPKVIYGHNCYHIQMSLQAKALQQGLFDYEANNNKPIKSEANQYNGNAGAYNQIAFNKSKELFASTPAVGIPSFLPAADDTLKAIAKSRGLQSAAGMYLVKGETSLHELRLGLTVEVDFKRQGEHGTHAPLRITRITHQIDASGNYTNNFEAIPAAAEAPPQMPFIKPVTFPMLAEVIDNKDNQGRVRVKFMGWQQEGLPETDFIRVLTPDAGGGGDKVAQNRGLVTVPEVGDQVYVDFEQGNPDRPFITGSVFHGKHGTGGGDTNKNKSLTTRSGCSVILDDSNGSAVVKDPSGNILTMHGDGTITLMAPNTFTINTTDFIVNASNSIALNAIPKEGGSGGEGKIDLVAKKDIQAVSQTENIRLTTQAKDILLTALAKDINLNSIAGKMITATKETENSTFGKAKITATGTLQINGADVEINKG